MPSSQIVKQMFALIFILLSTPIFSLSAEYSDQSRPVSQAVAPTKLWNRPYVGGFIGGVLGQYQAQTSAGTLSDTSYFSSSGDINSIQENSHQSLYPHAFIIGIKGGEDWAWQNLILGAVLDFASFPQHATRQISGSVSDPNGSYALNETLKTDWLFTLRGRAGLPFHRWWDNLAYVTAGMAMTRLTVANAYSDNSLLLGTESSSLAANQIGWTVGGGLESALNQNLSLTAEYLYIAIPSLTTTGALSNTVAGFGIPINSLSSPLATKGSLSSSLIRVGAHYRFNV